MVFVLFGFLGGFLCTSNPYSRAVTLHAGTGLSSPWKHRDWIFAVIFHPVLLILSPETTDLADARPGNCSPIQHRCVSRGSVLLNALPIRYGSDRRETGVARCACRESAA